MTDEQIEQMAEAEYPSTKDVVAKRGFIKGAKAVRDKQGFPKLIIEFNPDADETQYAYTAYLEGCKGMVVQATSKENCVQQMAISCEVKMRYDVTLASTTQ